jgi:hypothetical protein
MVYRETNVRRALNSVNSQVKTNDVMVKLGQSLKYSKFHEKLKIINFIKKLRKNYFYQLLSNSPNQHKE